MTRAIEGMIASILLLRDVPKTTVGGLSFFVDPASGHSSTSFRAKQVILGLA